MQLDIGEQSQVFFISGKLLERSQQIYDKIYLTGDAGRRRYHLMADEIAFSSDPIAFRSSQENY